MNNELFQYRQGNSSNANVSPFKVHIYSHLNFIYIQARDMNKRSTGVKYYKYVKCLFDLRIRAL